MGNGNALKNTIESKTGIYRIIYSAVEGYVSVAGAKGSYIAYADLNKLSGVDLVDKKKTDGRSFANELRGNSIQLISNLYGNCKYNKLKISPLKQFSELGDISTVPESMLEAMVLENIFSAINANGKKYYISSSRRNFESTIVPSDNFILAYDLNREEVNIRFLPIDGAIAFKIRKEKRERDNRYLKDIMENNDVYSPVAINIKLTSISDEPNDCISEIYYPDNFVFSCDFTQRNMEETFLRYKEIMGKEGSSLLTPSMLMSNSAVEKAMTADERIVSYCIENKKIYVAVSTGTYLSKEMSIIPEIDNVDYYVKNISKTDDLANLRYRVEGFYNDKILFTKDVSLVQRDFPYAGMEKELKERKRRADISKN